RERGGVLGPTAGVRRGRGFLRAAGRPRPQPQAGEGLKPMDDERCDYRIVLRPLASSVAEAIRLKAVLKYALRVAGFRCVSVVAGRGGLPPPPPAGEQDGPASGSGPA